MNHNLEFGKFIQKKRKEKNFTLKHVADKLEMDLSMLSKIENGERQMQGHMLKPLADLFNLPFKEIQMKYLYNKIQDEYGAEPYLRETLVNILEEKR